MCFYIDKNNPAELISKNDILCYKIVDFEYKPYHNRSPYSYKLNIEYKAMEYYWSNAYREVLSLINEKTVDFFNGKHYEVINEGIHSFVYYNISSTYEKYRRFSNAKLIFCVIPKGTPYYYNGDMGEYVSLKIRKIGLLEAFKILFFKHK